MNTFWIDIGNTRLKYWITPSNTSFTQPEILNHGAIIHHNQIEETLKSIQQHLTEFTISHLRLSSVLKPETNQEILAHLQKSFSDINFAKVLPQTHNITTLYDTRQLGIDRWLQIIAAAKENQNIAVIGCGTAITVDIVKNQHHIGGYIIPNMALQRAALVQGTQMVQIFQGQFTRTDYGINTADAVNNGISRMFSSFIHEIENSLEVNELIFTGGGALEIVQLIQPKLIYQIDPYLLLKGLIRYFNPVD